MIIFWFISTSKRVIETLNPVSHLNMGSNLYAREACEHVLTPKVPRPFFCQNHSKLLVLLCSPRKREKYIFLNLTIGFCTSFVSNHVVKISWSLSEQIRRYQHSKLEKKCFLKCWPAISDDFDRHLWKFLQYTLWI